MKIWIFFLAVLIAGKSSATEGAVGACPECSNTKAKIAISDLNQWSVSDKDVDQANCLHREPPTEREMVNYLKTVVVADPNRKETRTINGITFNDNSELLDLFTEFHRITDTSRKDRTPLKFNSECSDVLCAMNEIYGRPQGTQIFYIYARYGFKASTLTHNKNEYIPWTSSELNEIIGDFQTLPPQFFPFHRFERIILHSTISADVKDGREWANAAIQVLRPWFDGSPNVRLGVLVHELGHDIAAESNLDTSGAWMQASGWMVKGKSYGKPRTSPSLYAMNDPIEDFAETFAAYRLNPAALRSGYPQRYQYMKEHVFRGVEFTDAKSCQKPFQDAEAEIAKKQQAQKLLLFRRETEKKSIAQLIHKIAGPPPNLNEQQKVIIFKACLNPYLQEAVNGRPGAADACLTEEIRRQQALAITNNSADLQLLRSADLSSIQVSEAQKKQVRDFAKNYLTPLFYQTYKDDDLIQYTTSPQQCDTNAYYFYRSLPDELRAGIHPDSFNNGVPSSSLVQGVVAKACKERIKAFGTSLIGQAYNPFAKNTFEKVFNF